MEKIHFPSARFLAVEYSGAFLSFAWFESGVCQSFLVEKPVVQGAELWLPSLQKIVAKSELAKAAFLAISIGPGSFTSLRVSLASAYGLSQALKLPLIGVNSLEALAWSYLDQTEQDLTDGLALCPVIKAYQQEIYTACYSLERQAPVPSWNPWGLRIREIKPPRAERLADFGADFPSDARVFGPFFNPLNRSFVATDPGRYFPSAKGLGYALLEKETGYCEKFPQPLYLVQPYAVRSRATL